MRRGSLRSISLSAILGFELLVSGCSDRAGAQDRPTLLHRRPPTPEAGAKINDRLYTLQELTQDDQLAIFDLEMQIYKLKKDAVDKLRIQDILGADAKKAGLSLEDFIGKKVTGPLKVSGSEFQEFISQRKIDASKVTPEVREKIDSYLTMGKRNDLIMKYLAKHEGPPTEVYFDKPRLKMDLEIGDAPTFGKANAPITIMEFSDFECPYCATAAKLISEVKKKYAGKVRVVFKHFPLSFHNFARPAAEASMCVNDQGSDRFWKFHDEVFANREHLDAASLETYAKKAGANLADFKECVSNKRFASVVQSEMTYAQGKNIRSTPSFFLNGQPMPNGAQMKDFDEMIAEELLRLKEADKTS